MNWLRFALNAAENLHVTRQFNLKIAKLTITHPAMNGAVVNLEDIELTPQELASLVKEGLAQVYGPKSLN